VYNVGSEESVTIAEAAQAVARSVHPQNKVEILGAPNPVSPVEQYVPSTKRALDELGLSQNIFLREGIMRTITYLQGIEK
jgi:nucleoside-diphosphate-sugar epimerase